MTDKNDNNVFSLVEGTKKSDDGLPQFNYAIETNDSDEVDYVTGYPVFSPQYIMIMRELETGVTLPVYMKPIHLVKTFYLDEDDRQEELPF